MATIADRFATLNHRFARLWDGSTWVDEHRLGITGQNIAQVIAEMARLGIPLTAEVTADVIYDENGPEAFLSWYVPVDEPPQPARAIGSPRAEHQSADTPGASEKRRGQG